MRRAGLFHARQLCALPCVPDLHAYMWPAAALIAVVNVVTVFAVRASHT